MSDENSLTPAPVQLAALRECSTYRRGEYVWKPKTMQKLALLGYAEIIACTRPHRPSGSIAYTLTSKGRVALGYPA